MSANTVSGSFPIANPALTIFGSGSTLPFTLNFESGMGSNTVVRQFDSSQTVPLANAAGPQPFTGMALGTAPTNIGIASTAGGVTPNSGASMLLIDFPNGQGTGAFDVHFDLSAYAVASNNLRLTFAWNNTGEFDELTDNVFISVDGGTTWVASLFNFQFPTATGWNNEAIDLTTALVAAGSDFSSNVVIRFQASGAQGSPNGGLMIDDIIVETFTPTTGSSSGGGNDDDSGCVVSSSGSNWMYLLGLLCVLVAIARKRNLLV